MTFALFLRGCSSNTALPDSTKFIKQMVGRLVTYVDMCGCGEYVVRELTVYTIHPIVQSMHKQVCSGNIPTSQ